MWSWTDAIVLVNMESVNFEVHMGLNFCSRKFTGGSFPRPCGGVWKWAEIEEERRRGRE